MASHNRAKKIANLASIPNKMNYSKKRQLDSFASKTGKNLKKYITNSLFY